LSLRLSPISPALIAPGYREFMRPVRPIRQLVDLAPALGDRSLLEAMLIDALGSWCSICERRVLEQAWAWDARHQATVPTRAALADGAADWLLLCHNCQDAQRYIAPGSGDDLALPERDNTFALAGESVFRYELREVEVREDGGRREEVVWQVRQIAQITSDDPRGRATIERFALNGNSPNRAIVKDATRRDRRVELRTAAWESAARLAKELSDPDDAAAAQTLRTAMDTGFLSVWLTVFSNEHGRDWVSEWTGPVRAAENIPGTDWDRLLGAGAGA
jgi:hypothetical protein